MSNDSKKQYSRQNKISAKNEWTATENYGITELISFHNHEILWGEGGGGYIHLPAQRVTRRVLHHTCVRTLVESSV